MSAAEDRPRAGLIAPELQSEFPGLRLAHVTVAAERGASPRELVALLADLAGRHRGATAVTMRTHQIPSAYRAFFRQVGLDPDVRRVPSEQAAVDRLAYGGFRSTDRLNDACLEALLETGVPVWALDAAVVDCERIGIRTSRPADLERLRRDEYLAPGSLVVADDDHVHAVLFEQPRRGHGAGPGTPELVLFAVAVDGVPELHVDESLQIAADWLGQRL